MINYFLNSIIAIVTSILLLIFSFFIISQRDKKRVSSILLSLFLLSNSIFLIAFIVPAIESSLNISVAWFGEMGFYSSFLFGPLLFLFTRSITGKNYKLELKKASHFLLFILLLILFIGEIHIPYSVIFGILIIQLFTYFIICIVLINKYRDQVKEYFSSVHKINLTWLLYVVGGFFLMWFIDLVNFTLSEFQINNLSLENILTFLSISINFVFVMLIFYQALRQPEFLFGISEEMDIPKYRSSKLTRTEKEIILKNIEDFFEAQKPFLNPFLTIKDVSEEINVPSKYVSQVINESLNKNFYDFINSYRVEEASQQLSNEVNKDKTILEILYNSGFNSKSAFNTAFKKHWGITPSKYRQQYKNM